MMNKFIGTCFKGPKAKSHDFFLIKKFGSASWDTSLCAKLAAVLYPGGELNSVTAFLSLFLQKEQKL